MLGGSLIAMGLTLLVLAWFFRAVGRIPGPYSGGESLSPLERVGAARGEVAPRMAPRLFQLGIVFVVSGLVALVAVALM